MYIGYFYIAVYGGFMKRKRKRKVSIKKISRLLVILIVSVLIISNIGNVRNIFISKSSGYKFNTVQTFFENDIYDDIKNYDYSKTLEAILESKYYDISYIKEYPKINYVKDDSFLENISILLDKGYSSNDINKIYDVLNDEGIIYLINNNYFEKIYDVLNVSYFNSEYLERYMDYYNTTKDDIDVVVTYVNIGLDNDYYTNVVDILEPDSITVLVNKYNKLQNDFVPADLKNVSYGTGKLTKVAAEAFDLMCSKALEEKVKIYGGSGYRSYSYQSNLYNRYVSEDGKALADTYAARAGYSEHQTGLAMDILNGRWGYIDENDKEFAWLKDNSYKYGFILRYLDGKEKITGYMYEPWHFRYVGVELATEITRLGITYDEYVAKNS